MQMAMTPLNPAAGGPLVHLGCSGLRAGKIPLPRVRGLAGRRATPLQGPAGRRTMAQVRKCSNPVLPQSFGLALAGKWT